MWIVLHHLVERNKVVLVENLGLQAIDMYTETKHVWVDLNEEHMNWYGI